MLLTTVTTFYISLPIIVLLLQLFFSYCIREVSKFLARHILYIDSKRLLLIQNYHLILLVSSLPIDRGSHIFIIQILLKATSLEKIINLNKSEQVLCYSLSIQSSKVLFKLCIALKFKTSSPTMLFFSFLQLSCISPPTSSSTSLPQPILSPIN